MKYFNLAVLKVLHTWLLKRFSINALFVSRPNETNPVIAQGLLGQNH